MFVSQSFQVSVDVLKVDAPHGLVFGWAIVCKNGEELYVDTQGHHIPEDEMLAGALDFAKNSRIAGDMHERTDGQPIIDGSMVFLFPMTSEVAKSFGITTPKTGLMVAALPSSEVLAKFVSGEYTGFSIGGSGEEHSA